LTGGVFSLTHLDGRKLNCSCESTQIISGEDLYKIEGEGMPILGQPHNGNLFVQFEILFPKKLSAKQQQALRSIFNSNPEPHVPGDIVGVVKLSKEDQSKLKKPENFKNTPHFIDHSESNVDEGPQCTQM